MIWAIIVVALMLKTFYDAECLDEKKRKEEDCEI